MIFLALWPWVYLGLGAGLAFWLYVWRYGDWSFASSDLALVECEEEDVDYSQAPERVMWFKAGRSAAWLALLLLIGYALSGVG